MQQSQNLLELVDEKLGSEFIKEEAERMIKVGLLCTNASPSLRPAMSEAVSMLKGNTSLPEIIPEPSVYGEDLRFKAMRDLHRHRQSLSISGSNTQVSTAMPTEIGSSTSASYSN